MRDTRRGADPSGKCAQVRASSFNGYSRESIYVYDDIGGGNYHSAPANIGFAGLQCAQLDVGV